MTQIEEVAENVFRLDVPLPAMNSVFGVYLIDELGGAVIEPGPAISAPHIQDAMRQLGMSDLTWIIPTHLHIDHAGSVGTLARIFPGAKVLVHPRGAKHVMDPARLIESFGYVWGADFEASFGPVLPVIESQVQAVKDREMVTVGDRELEIIHAPGHAPHQIVVFDGTSEGIFCGDALGMLAQGVDSFPLPNTAPPDFDQDTYQATICSLGQLGAKTLFYSHGGVQHDARKLISLALENTQQFGDIVSGALQEGLTTDAIVDRIQEAVASRFGVELGDVDLETVVVGYTLYFGRQ